MESLLREALSCYGLEGARTRLIRHNENATYRVDDQGRAFVLRIHAPRPEFQLAAFSVDRHGRSKLEGELAMLDALADAAVPVQRPIGNRAGERVSALSTGDCATLLTWIEGETVSEVTPEIAREAGALAARMRDVFRGLGNLPEIDRYAYDEALADRLRDLLAEGFSGAELADMEGALAAVRANMEAARARGGEYGLIHADLSKGNLIVTERGLAPIDFCLSGRGFYAQDAGGLVADFGERFRPEICAGAQMKDSRAVDLFVAFGVLLFLASQYRGAKGQEWFPRALERWRRTLFQPLFK